MGWVEDTLAEMDPAVEPAVEPSGPYTPRPVGWVEQTMMKMYGEQALDGLTLGEPPPPVTPDEVRALDADDAVAQKIEEGSRRLDVNAGKFIDAVRAEHLPPPAAHHEPPTQMGGIAGALRGGPTAPSPPPEDPTEGYLFSHLPMVLEDALQRGAATAKGAISDTAGTLTQLFADDIILRQIPGLRKVEPREQPLVETAYTDQQPRPVPGLQDRLAANAEYLYGLGDQYARQQQGKIMPSHRGIFDEGTVQDKFRRAAIWAAEGVGEQIPLMVPTVATALAAASTLPASIPTGAALWLGGVSAEAPLQIGITARTIKERTGESHPPEAIFYGLIGAGVGAAGEAIALGPLIGRSLQTSGIKNATLAKIEELLPGVIAIIKASGKSVAAESPAEAIQNLTENMPADIIKGEKILTPERWGEMVDNAFAVIPGAAFTAGAGAAVAPSVIRERPPEMSIEQFTEEQLTPGERSRRASREMHRLEGQRNAAARAKAMREHIQREQARLEAAGKPAPAVEEEVPPTEEAPIAPREPTTAPEEEIQAEEAPQAPPEAEKKPEPRFAMTQRQQTEQEIIDGLRQDIATFRPGNPERTRLEEDLKGAEQRMRGLGAEPLPAPIEMRTAPKTGQGTKSEYLVSRIKAYGGLFNGPEVKNREWGPGLRLRVIKKDGYGYDELATELGFQNGDELLDAIEQEDETKIPHFAEDRGASPADQEAERASFERAAEERKATAERMAEEEDVKLTGDLNLKVGDKIKFKGEDHTVTAHRDGVLTLENGETVTIDDEHGILPVETQIVSRGKKALEEKSQRRREEVDRVSRITPEEDAAATEEIVKRSEEEFDKFELEAQEPKKTKKKAPEQTRLDVGQAQAPEGKVGATVDQTEEGEGLFAPEEKEQLGLSPEFLAAADFAEKKDRPAPAKQETIEELAKRAREEGLLEEKPKEESFSRGSVKKAFRLTDEQAEGVVAVAESMGIDTSKLRVVRGGKAGKGSLFQYVGEKARGFKPEFSSLSDRKARMEIDDSGARLKKTIQLDAYGSPMGGNPTLPEVLDHSELYEAYPRLRDVKVGIYPGHMRSADVNTIAGYDKSNNTIYHVTPWDDYTGEIDSRILDALMHEIQHVIQTTEDFSPGTSPDEVAFKWGGGIEGLFSTRKPISPKRALKLYRAHAGEHEARDTAARLNLTKEERKQTPPLSTEKKLRLIFQDDKGAVEFVDVAKTIIHAFQNADVSTALHELAHVARRQLFGRDIPAAQRAGITDADIATVEKWAGVKDGKWTTKAEEKFARGFERYIHEGKAPTPQLRDVFRKLSEWLKGIYTHLKGSDIDVNISPEMRKVFDKLVTRKGPRFGQTKKTKGPKVLKQTGPRFGRGKGTEKDGIIYPKDVEQRTTFKSDSAERSFQASKGKSQKPLYVRVRERLRDFRFTFRRAWMHLDPVRHALEAEILRRLKDVRQIAEHTANTEIRAILEPIIGDKAGKLKYEIFTKAIILPDIIRDVRHSKLYTNEDGEVTGLPFGLTVKELYAENEHFQKLAEANPDIKKALESRALYMRGLKEELVAEGILPATVLAKKYDAYFHHQTLKEIAGVVATSDTPAGARATEKAFQKKRTGAAAYNTEYLEAEHRVITQAREQLLVFDALREIRELADISDQLRAAARRRNKDNSDKGWENDRPEGYALWSPDTSPQFHWIQTYTQETLDKLQEKYKAGEEYDLKDADVQRFMVLEPKSKWVIPEGLAKTLDKFEPGDKRYSDSTIERFLGSTLSRWKQWVLINPLRVFRYNINNMSGDLDIAMAYNPRIVLQDMWPALKELWRHGRAGSKPSEFINDAIAARVIDSGFAGDEVADISKADFFRTLTGGDHWAKRNVKRIWGGPKRMTQFRENVLRLAAYRFFLRELGKGKKLYGASSVKQIDKIVSVERRAAKMARELIGDYGNLTEGGKWLRAHMIPFYSWMEINAPRYVRMMRNMAKEGRSKGDFARAGAIKAGTTIGINYARFVVGSQMFYFLLNMYNRHMWPEEEKQLGASRKNHLILWRNRDHSLQTLRFQGSWSDALSWFALEDIAGDIRDVRSGEVPFDKKLQEAWQAPINRLAQGVRPDLKLLAELAGGERWYPNVFDPRPVRDWGQHITSTVTADKFWNYAKGYPGRPWINEFTVSLFSYRSDPGMQAYYDMKNDTNNWLEEQGMQRAFPAPVRSYKKGTPNYEQWQRSQALYRYRQALRYKQQEKADKYKQQYMDHGGTERGMRRSIRLAHPLSSIPKKHQRKYKESLTPRQLDVLQRATKWYNDIFLDK